MGTLELRQEAKALIDRMSDAQLRVASEFRAIVKEREADAATLELLTIPGFKAFYARGLRNIKAGRTKPWGKVRSGGKQGPAVESETATGWTHWRGRRAGPRGE